MAIQRMTSTLPINPGQWIIDTPMLRDAHCSRPKKVIKASGQRIYFLNRHGEDNGTYLMRGTVMYLCDTEEEAQSIFAISEAQFAAIQAVKTEHADKVRAMIKGAA